MFRDGVEHSFASGWQEQDHSCHRARAQDNGDARPGAPDANPVNIGFQLKISTTQNPNMHLVLPCILCLFNNLRKRILFNMHLLKMDLQENGLSNGLECESSYLCTRAGAVDRGRPK